jgi:FAD/FMN-containing dehydrogenase
MQDSHSRPLNTPDQAVLDRLAAALGAGGLRPPEPRYLEEPRGRFPGQAAAVLLPATTDQAAAAVRICAGARIGIVPYGGGTGLVGGQTLSEGPLPVILSLERMNAVRETDLTGNVMVAGAGAILADVQTAAREAGRLFPLSLASEGSARIGGLLATNAGGVNVLRYGSTRDLCLGVEAVMADGQVLHGLSRVVKDNMGYDLRHLLIGSEGTLGIITAASLRLMPQPSQIATAWISTASPSAALSLLAALRSRLGGTISAFELMHAQGFDFLAETLPRVRVPDLGSAEWIVLCEVADGEGSNIAARLETALSDALEDGMALDVLIAQNAAQRDGFWRVREAIPQANRKIGSISSHDISLPAARLAEFITKGAPLIARIDPGLRINCFGHLGDGNLHYNVFPARGRSRDEYDALGETTKRAVHDLTDQMGGSVGAEHGVGRLKTGDLERYGDPAKLAAMRAIKSALDPDGILNPGAVLRN